MKNGISGNPMMQMEARQFNWLERSIISTVISLSMLGVYMFTASHPRGMPATVHMPDWVPFWPQATPLYLALLLVTWWLPVAIRNSRDFLRCQAANLFAYLLVMPWWVLLPTKLDRPKLREETWMRLYEILTAVDPPTNIRPCAHGIGPLVAVWFFTYEHRSWRWPLLAATCLSLGSIAVTYQHRPVDILLGIVAAIAAVSLVGRKGCQFDHDGIGKHRGLASQ